MKKQNSAKMAHSIGLGSAKIDGNSLSGEAISKGDEKFETDSLIVKGIHS
jgi:hypothetical protein